MQFNYLLKEIYKRNMNIYLGVWHQYYYYNSDALSYGFGS